MAIRKSKPANKSTKPLSATKVKGTVGRKPRSQVFGTVKTRIYNFKDGRKTYLRMNMNSREMELVTKGTDGRTWYASKKERDAWINKFGKVQ